MRVGHDLYNTLQGIYIYFFMKFLHLPTCAMVESSRVRPAVGPQNSRPRQCSSSARVRHPRGCPTGVGYTRSHVSAPWGVKSITNSSRYKERPTRQTNVPAIIYAVSELVRSVASVRSISQLDDESSEAHCVFCDQP